MLKNINILIHFLLAAKTNFQSTIIEKERKRHREQQEKKTMHTWPEHKHFVQLKIHVAIDSDQKEVSDSLESSDEPKSNEDKEFQAQVNLSIWHYVGVVRRVEFEKETSLEP